MRSSVRRHCLSLWRSHAPILGSWGFARWPPVATSARIAVPRLRRRFTYGRAVKKIVLIATCNLCAGKDAHREKAAIKDRLAVSCDVLRSAEQARWPYSRGKCRETGETLKLLNSVRRATVLVRTTCAISTRGLLLGQTMQCSKAPNQIYGVDADDGAPRK